MFCSEPILASSKTFKYSEWTTVLLKNDFFSTNGQKIAIGIQLYFIPERNIIA